MSIIMIETTRLLLLIFTGWLAAVPAESLAAKRPAWLDAPPRQAGDAYQTVVHLGPYTTRLECDAQVPDALEKALAEYVELHLGREAADRVRLPADELRSYIKDQWEEVLPLSVGPMMQLHLRLEFDSKFQKQVQDAWRRLTVAVRLRQAALALAGVLALLALVYIGLRLPAARGRSRLEGKGGIGD